MAQIFNIEAAVRMPNVGKHTPYEVKLEGAGWFYIENEQDAVIAVGDAVSVDIQLAA